MPPRLKTFASYGAVGCLFIVIVLAVFHLDPRTPLYWLIGIPAAIVLSIALNAIIYRR